KAEEATLVEGRQAKNLMKAIEEANKLTGSQSVCIINDCYSIVTNLNCGLISNKRDQFKSGSCNFENGSGVSATVRDEVAGRILKAVENAGFNVELYVNHK